MNKIFLFLTLIAPSLAYCMDDRSAYFNTIQARPWLLFQDAGTRRGRAQAFAMATHPRVGVDSAARFLPRELVHEIAITATIGEWLEQHHEEIEAARMMEQGERNEALRNAARDGNIIRVRIMLYAGANVNAAYRISWTPLHGAAWNGHTETVTALIAAPGIDVNAADNNGDIPLHYAAFYGCTEIAIALIAAHGINVNTADRNGYTPLHCAANLGHTETVTALLAAGADRTMRITGGDNNGMTAVELARNQGNNALADLIEQWGHGNASGEIAGPANDILEEPDRADETTETIAGTATTTVEGGAEVAVHQPAQPSRIMSIVTNPLTIATATAAATVALAVLSRYMHR